MTAIGVNTASPVSDTDIGLTPRIPLNFTLLPLNNGPSPCRNGIFTVYPASTFASGAVLPISLTFPVISLSAAHTGKPRRTIVRMRITSFVVDFILQLLLCVPSVSAYHKEKARETSLSALSATLSINCGFSVLQVPGQARYEDCYTSVTRHLHYR